MLRSLGLIVASFLFAASLMAQERGTVIAIHATTQNFLIPGRHGGDGVVPTDAVSGKYVLQVYRIETATKFYELEDGRKARVALGDTLDFRIEKGKAILLLGGKQRKLRIVGEELKPK